MLTVPGMEPGTNTADWHSDHCANEVVKYVKRPLMMVDDEEEYNVP